MSALSADLYEMGYERTERESPFEDGGTLWSDGTELVCDKTGFVIRTTENYTPQEEKDWEYFRYPNSKKIRMVGGFFGSYDWGYDEDTFTY